MQLSHKAVHMFVLFQKITVTSNDLSYEIIAMIISHNDVKILNNQYVYLYLALSQFETKLGKRREYIPIEGK